MPLLLLAVFQTVLSAILQALGRLAANRAAEYMQRANPTGNFAPMSPSKAGLAYPASTPRSRAGQAFPANTPRRTSSPRKSFTPRRTFSPRRTGSPRKRLTDSLRPGTAESTSEEREAASANRAVEKGLSSLLADALSHRCFDYNVDAAWMGATHEAWRTVLASSIHKSSLNRRLAAGGSVRAIEAAPAPAAGRRADDEQPADQVLLRPPSLASLQLHCCNGTCLLCHALQSLQCKLTVCDFAVGYTFIHVAAQCFTQNH